MVRAKNSAVAALWQGMRSTLPHAVVMIRITPNPSAVLGIILNDIKNLNG